MTKPVRPSQMPSQIPADRIALWKRGLRPQRNHQINLLMREFRDVSPAHLIAICDWIEAHLFIIGFGSET